MRYFWLKFAVLVAPLALSGPSGGVYAQGNDLNSQGGLESATPTDNVNEVGAGANSSGGGDAAINDFPAGESKADFDVGGNNAGSGDSLFGDEAPADLGSGSGNVVSAFGNNTANAAKPVGKKPAGKPGNAVPGNTLPGNALPGNLPVNPLPVNTTPVNNASKLGAGSGSGTGAGTNVAPLNGLNANQGNGSGSGTVSGSGSNATATNDATNASGNDALTPAPPKEQEIKAPPLPPPNEFAGAPPIPGTMRQMADGEAPEEYLVQPGDTLFDICDQLLDEASYWPKLWALNPDIKNPHFIFPNMKLRFYPGDDETPPYLQVVAEDDVIPIDKGDLDEQELVAEKVIYPGESEAGTLDSATFEVIGPEGVDALQDAILMGGKRYEGAELNLQVPGFIFAEEKEAVGYVIAGREGEVSAGPGTRILIENSSGLAAGTLYTVLRKGEAVVNPVTGDRVGQKYYFVSNARVVKVIEGDLYMGIVEGNPRLTVFPDDILVSFISTQRTIPSGSNVGSVSSKEANIVGFQYEDQLFEGDGHFVFLDKGNSDGMAPGMYLPVYQSPSFMSSKISGIDLPDDFEQIAVIRIVDTTDAGACGYIVRNSREIRLGDRTHKG